MKIQKLIHKIISSYNTKEVEGTKVWVVSWDARYDHFNSDRRRVAKAFLSEEDALTFMKSLKEAQNLLQYSEYLEISIVEQR